MPRVHARTIFLSFDADAYFSNQLPASVPNPTHHLAHLELLTSTLHLGRLLISGPQPQRWKDAPEWQQMPFTGHIYIYIYIYIGVLIGIPENHFPWRHYVPRDYNTYEFPSFLSKDEGELFYTYT